MEGHPNELYWLLNSRAVAATRNLVLLPGKVVKHPSNPLFVEDQTWEARYDNFYGTVIYDTSNANHSYKCWYNPFTQDRSAQGMSLEQRQQEPYRPPQNRQMSVCYAISSDGIHWTKPHLDLIEHNGSTANNIVVKSVPNGAGVYDDRDNPFDSDPTRRYKMPFTTKSLTRCGQSLLGVQIRMSGIASQKTRR